MSPGTNGLMSPSMGTKVTLLLNYTFWVRIEGTLKRKKSLLPVGPEPGISWSAVQCFSNHLATKQLNANTNQHPGTNGFTSPPKDVVLTI